MIEVIPAGLDAVARAVADSAFKVHTEPGPGLLESVYEILKLAKKRLGLLINFNVSRIRDGIKRIAL